MVTPTASTTSSRATPPPKRNSTTPTSPPSISRGATARSAVSPRGNSPLNAGHARRASLKAPIPAPALQNGTASKEALEANLKQEIEEKEQLLVRVQNLEQTIASLTTENTNINSALHAAEVRLSELYEEQNRSEQELANRIDISEKLRTQLRELEKEKRDLQRRYNEQISTFDAERQALYDNEQHLKSRIQSLSQAKKQSTPEPTVADPESEAETEPEEEAPRTPLAERTNDASETTTQYEPPEMTALRNELSTLSTSYASLHTMVAQMQTQLADLKRVNHELQEENESYMILLRERTLSGQFDPLRQVVGEADDAESDGADVVSLRSKLDRVDEESDEDLATLEDDLERTLDQSQRGSHKSSRRRTTSSISRTSGGTRGESLADLPISGPGLDLAAELGRAENKDILDGSGIDDERPSNRKRSKKSAHDSEVDSLRTEVKALKDANKALSLYASRIIDRIIAEEGFERVLAVDYDKPSGTTTATTNPPEQPPKPPPSSNDGSSSDNNSSSKPRPQSVIVGRSASNPTGPTSVQSPPLTTFQSFSTSASGSAGTMVPSLPEKKAQRRSLSFDWRGFSIWGSEKKAEPSPTLKPLTLKPGVTSVTSSANGSGTARKLETEEDEEDRKERERMYATMKLMGIQSPPPPPSPHIQRAHSNSSPVPPSPATPATVTTNRRFSFFGRSNSTNSSPDPNNANPPPSLTQDALVQAEAESSLAALDAHEQKLSAELAKGSSGSFTEIQPRASRRKGSRKSGDSRSGSNRSGSTVFSAGIEEE